MTESPRTYHEPVLLQASVQALRIKPEGTYVDATFGGGGHSRAIIRQLGPNGTLVAFDRDADARANAIRDVRFTLVEADYRWAYNHLRYLDKLPVDGLLADLGVSSHQFDTAERGFSFRFDAPLDMRMSHRGGKTAADLVNGLGQDALADVLLKYGEVHPARRIAKSILQRRAESPIRTTGELAEAVRPLARRGQERTLLAQVFQALRIAVNDELAALESLLRDSERILAKGGRLVVISYHSLEDRLVKNWMRAGNLAGKEEKDLYGNRLRPFVPVPGKAVQPTPQEQERNPRARSARMRTAIRQ